MTVKKQQKSGTHQTEKGTVPEIMLAAAIDQFGGPEVSALHKLPMPPLGTREVLIQLHTAGVGVWDADRFLEPLKE